MIIRFPKDARILREILFAFLPDLPPAFPNTITYQPTTVRVGNMENAEKYRLSGIILDWQEVKVAATIAIYSQKTEKYPQGKRVLHELKVTRGRDVRRYHAQELAHLPPW